MLRGQLTTWNESKGFGFIKCENLKKDVFIHISELKHMSRPPKVGDLIHFDIEQQAQGKIRAIKARIEGVKLKQVKQRGTKESESTWISNFAMFLVIIAVCFYGFKEFTAKQKRAELANSTVTHTSINEPHVPAYKKSNFSSAKSDSFQCDGRKYCSQMTSLNEARFFINNCPGTKMDGDNDGNPCESDSRF